MLFLTKGGIYEVTLHLPKCFIYYWTILYFIGFVGLLLPIAPQVPFFIIGAICLMKSSNRIRDCVKQHALYKKHCQKFIEKSKLLKRILG